jgi:uncharacterized protein (TIGR02145 family)
LKFQTRLRADTLPIKLNKMKKLLLFLIVSLLINACAKQKTTGNMEMVTSSNESGNISTEKSSTSILICHRQPNGTWQLKTINFNTWSQHEAHGDVRLDDQDGDGYVPNNACAVGNQGDCNDTNWFIHPGVAEICNGVDDNCNGVIDESCQPAVIIGNQVWMSKNLEVTSYRNGDMISTSWGITLLGAWSYYENDPAYGLVYGKLYNGFAVLDPRGLAPVGWHVPTEQELNILLRYLDPATDTTNNTSTPSFVAGGLMKEVGTAHWISPNGGATNASGFSGLPGGWRDDEGTASNLGKFGQWWTSTGHIDVGNPQGGGGPGSARNFYLTYGDGRIVEMGTELMWGFSVRCVRDN